MEKPEGFEFRDRRSDKTGRSSDWTPADAAYSASQCFNDATLAAIVVWLDEAADGTYEIRFRLAGGSANGALLASKFLQAL